MDKIRVEAKMLGLRYLKGRRGNLVITMAIAIVVVITLGMMLGYLTNFNKAVKKTEAENVVQVIFVSLKSMIDNDITWKSIIRTSNPALSCLLDSAHPGALCPQASGNLVVSGPVLVDGIKGFDQFSRVCTTFSKTSPNPQCPYRFTITWKLICQNHTLSVTGNNCPTTFSPLSSIALDPVVQVDISFESASGSTNLRDINAKRYTSSFMRGGSNSIEAACYAANAGYDAKTQSCIVQTKQCDPGTILKGFNTLGVPICEVDKFFNTRCLPRFAATLVLGGGGFGCNKF
jgi:hypothetical protein